MKKILFLLPAILLLAAATPARAASSVMDNLERVLQTAAKQAVHPVAVSSTDANVFSITQNAQNNQAEITFQTRASQFSVHPKQMVFRGDVYQQVNDVDVKEQDGKVTMRFDASRFEAYSVKLATTDFNYELPVMLDEVTSGSWQYNVTVSVILQQENKNNQLTSFYFLIPKERT